MLGSIMRFRLSINIVYPLNIFARLYWQQKLAAMIFPVVLSKGSILIELMLPDSGELAIWCYFFTELIDQIYDVEVNLT